MRSTITIISIMLSVASANAQVVLEHTYNYSAAVCYLESQGYKYYLMDVPNAQCRIYNPDHSLFRTISCNVPLNSFLADIQLVSENIFDNDPGIELVYTWYRYVPAGDSFYYIYGSRIIQEDGSLLQDIEGARYVYLNEVQDGQWKLFAYCFDYSVWPEKVWTNIYSLAGSPVNSAALTEASGAFSVNMIPNPARNNLKVSYKLPEGAREGVLYIFSSNGKLEGRFAVDNHTDHLLLDISRYKSGLYYYFVESGNRRSPSGKLVVQ